MIAILLLPSQTAGVGYLKLSIHYIINTVENSTSSKFCCKKKLEQIFWLFVHAKLAAITGTNKVIFKLSYCYVGETLRQEAQRDQADAGFKRRQWACCPTGNSRRKLNK
ncbi:hypothetical protein ABZP36_025356 [Zizania latifolia]